MDGDEGVEDDMGKDWGSERLLGGGDSGTDYILEGLRVDEGGRLRRERSWVLVIC